MVELQPSKLITRVRFPSPAPMCVSTGLVALVAKPVLILMDQCPCGSVVEHSLGKGEVARSIRAMGTIAQQENPKWQKANLNARSRT